MRLLVPRETTARLIVHASDTPNRDPSAKAHTINDKRDGYLACRFHLIVRRSGRLETARPIWSVGSHLHGHNWDSIGLCLNGGLDEDQQPDFKPRQFDALEAIVRDLREAYPDLDVLGADEAMLGTAHLETVGQANPYLNVRLLIPSGTTS